MFPELQNAPLLALDIETHDPDLRELGCGCRRDGFICGVSLAVPGQSWYFPTRHASGNLPEEQVFGYLKNLAKNFKGRLVGANILYDLDYLAQYGVTPSDTEVVDVQHNEALISEWRQSYSLDAIAQYYGLPGKSEHELLAAAAELGCNNPKKAKGLMAQLPASVVEQYAKNDAELCLKILEKQLPTLTSDLAQVWELEKKVWWVVFAMRRMGVRVDTEQIQHNERLLSKEIESILSGIKRECPFLEVDETILTNPRKLIRHLGIATPLTPSGMPKVTNEWLNMQVLPELTLLARGRKLLKARDSFVLGIAKHVVNGRIHANFNQLKGSSFSGGTEGVGPGRFSSTCPNLQQIPARDPEIGPLIRKQFIADEGKQFCAIDFSQQEPRIAIHYANMLGLDGASEAVAKYRANPKLDGYSLVSESAGIERSQAKTIFLGLSYGMGGAKLCAQLGLPTKTVTGRDGKPVEVAGKHGSCLIDAFNNGVPYVSKLRELVVDKAKQRGYIVTLSGRRCRLEKGTRGEHLYAYKALNNLIQGTAADMTKMAMVALYEKGFTPSIQVHDELCLSVESSEQAQYAARLMETALPLSLPNYACPEVGPSWGELSEIAD